MDCITKNFIGLDKGKNAAKLIEFPKTPPKKQLDFNGYKLCNLIQNNVPKQKSVNVVVAAFTDLL